MSGEALLQHIRDLEKDLDAAREALRRELAGNDSPEALELLLLMESERYRRSRHARDLVERNVVELTERATAPRPKVMSKTRIVELLEVPEFTLYEWLRKAKGRHRKAAA